MLIRHLYESASQDFPDELADAIMGSKFFKLNLEKDLKSFKSEYDTLSAEVYIKDFLYSMLTDLSHKFLFHGSKGMDKPYIVTDFKFRARPVDTLRSVHNYTNSLFSEKFKVPLRNLLFATKNSHIAGVYGTRVLVIPLSDYALYSAKDVVDFTNKFNVASTDNFGAGMIDHIRDYIEQGIEFGGPDVNTVKEHSVIKAAEGIPRHSIISSPTLEEFEQQYIEAFEETLKTFGPIGDNDLRVCVEFVHDRLERYIDNLKKSLGEYADSTSKTRSMNQVIDQGEIMLHCEKMAFIRHTELQYAGLIPLFKKIMDKL